MTQIIIRLPRTASNSTICVLTSMDPEKNTISYSRQCWGQKQNLLDCSNVQKVADMKVVWVMKIFFVIITIYVY